MEYNVDQRMDAVYHTLLFPDRPLRIKFQPRDLNQNNKIKWNIFHLPNNGDNFPALDLTDVILTRLLFPMFKNLKKNLL